MKIVYRSAKEHIYYLVWINQVRLGDSRKSTVFGMRFSTGAYISV